MSEIIQKVQKRMLISLADISKRMDLHEGDYISIEERDGGVFLKPVEWHDKNQQYFWTDEWQTKMKKSKEALEKGNYTVFRNTSELLTKLGGIANADDHHDGSV